MYPPFVSVTVYVGNTPYANMADHSVVALDELCENEASWALAFCFDNASPERPCFVGDLICFNSLCILCIIDHLIGQWDYELLMSF